MTAAKYPALPPRIPIHIRLDGTANNYGPRLAAWILPGLQLVIAVTYGFSYALGAPVTLLIVGVCALAVLWRAQLLIISAAASGAKRVPTLGFWIFFVGVAVAGAVVARYSGGG
jgi:hypothetical protein